MSKHKEIKRWVAGTNGWEDTLVVACATLVETPKLFRLVGSKKSDRRSYGPAERAFYRNHGWRSQWNKRVYEEVGSDTYAAAVDAFVKQLEEEVKRAECVLSARKYNLESVKGHIAHGSDRVIE